jgi:hypothetical protein
MRAAIIGIVCLAICCGSAVGFGRMITVGQGRDRRRYQQRGRLR